MAVTIKCKSCGNENPMGDVFCRKCGGELEIENIDPGKLRKKHGKGCFTTIVELLTIGLMLAFFAVGACLFITPSDSRMDTLGNEDKKQVDALSAEINKAIKGEIRTRSFDLHGRLAGPLFKKTVLTSDHFEEYYVKIDPVNNDTFKFHLKTGGRGMPFTVSVICKVIEGEINDETHWQIGVNRSVEVLDTRVGLIPLTSYFAPFIKKTFFQFFELQTFTDMRTHLDNLIPVPDKGLTLVVFRQGDKRKK